MRDVLVLATTVAFFALCVAYVRWCDHIIGPDPDGLRDEDVDDVDDVEGDVVAGREAVRR
jgi:hypothetical protein